MTAKQLLLPRFEVIADYPGAMYKAGDILELFGNSQVLKDPIFYVKGKPTCYYFALSELEKYPHIFRRMPCPDEPKKIDLVVDDSWIPVETLPWCDMSVEWICEDGAKDFGFFYHSKGQCFASFDRSSTAPVKYWKPYKT